MLYSCYTRFTDHAQYIASWLEGCWKGCWKGREEERCTHFGRDKRDTLLVIHDDDDDNVTIVSRVDREKNGQRLKGKRKLKWKKMNHARGPNASRRACLSLNSRRVSRTNNWMIKCERLIGAACQFIIWFVHSRDRTRERRWMNWWLRIELIDVRLCYYVAVNETVVDKWA